MPTTTKARARTASHRVSTSEYGLSVAPKSEPSHWNYAYAQGAGADRGKRPSYPIDPEHVSSALSRSAQKNTAGSARTVRAAVAKRYGSVAKGLAAHRQWVARHNQASHHAQTRS
jgi:hypothetical protein